MAKSGTMKSSFGNQHQPAIQSRKIPRSELSRNRQDGTCLETGIGNMSCFWSTFSSFLDLTSFPLQSCPSFFSYNCLFPLFSPTLLLSPTSYCFCFLWKTTIYKHYWTSYSLSTSPPFFLFWAESLRARHRRQRLRHRFFLCLHIYKFHAFNSSSYRLSWKYAASHEQYGQPPRIDQLESRVWIRLRCLLRE